MKLKLVKWAAGQYEYLVECARKSNNTYYAGQGLGSIPDLTKKEDPNIALEAGQKSKN